MSDTGLFIRDFFDSLREQVEERQKITTDAALKEQLEWFLKCIDEEEKAFNEGLANMYKQALNMLASKSFTSPAALAGLGKVEKENPVTDETRRI